MENSRYRARQRKYNQKRKPVSVGKSIFNDLIQQNVHIDNETHADESTDFVNDMWWGDANDSADDDDSDYDPDEDNEDSDDSNDDDYHINDASAMNNDEKVEELFFIEESIYPSGFNFSKSLKEVL
jgi:hypothetical protein